MRYPQNCFANLTREHNSKLSPLLPASLSTLSILDGIYDWEQCKLGDIFEERTEKSTTGNEELLSVTLKDGVVKTNSLNRKNNASDDRRSYKLVIQDDIAYNSMRMWQGALGVSRYKGIVSPAYTVVKLRNRVENPYFYQYYFKKQEILNLFRKNSQGLTPDTWNLKYPLFSQIRFLTTNAKEQRKISLLLISLDHTITLHEEKHRQLEQLKKALLQKKFADETGYPVLRFKGFTEKWEQRKFSELYSKNVERNSTNEFNFDKTISIANMRYNSEGNGASKKSLQNYKVIRIGDVAFEGHTNKEFQYGRFVVNSLGNGIMSPRFAVLRPIRPTVVNFWKYYLHNERSMNRILVHATKAGTMMNELVYSDLAKEKIKVPIEKEQIEIGNLFSILDRTITLHDKKIQYLKQLKRGLLQKMFV